MDIGHANDACHRLQYELDQTNGGGGRPYDRGEKYFGEPPINKAYRCRVLYDMLVSNKMGGRKMNTAIIEKANQIIKTCDAAYFGVIDEDGYPSVSTVSPTGTESIHEVFFTTNIGGNKEKRLRKSSRASICFRSGNDNITLVGDAEILTDQEIKSRMWQEWFISHYPGGEADPNYIVVKLTTKRVSLWVDFEIAEAML